jgi:hypothetical protein
MKKIIVILLMIQVLFADIVYEKLNDTSMSLETRMIKQKEKHYFTVDVPNGEELTVRLKDLSADVDLYVSEGWSEPKLTSSDCKSINANQEEEICTLFAPNYVRHNIMVYGFRDASYKIIPTMKKEQVVPLIGETAIYNHIKMNMHQIYKVASAPGEIVRIRLSELSGDADLKVNIDKRVEKNSFNCKSRNAGKKVDECTVSIPTNQGYDALTYIYIDIDGFRTADYKLEHLKVEKIEERESTENTY